MTAIIKDKITSWIVGEVIIDSVEKLRKLERDYIVIPFRKGKREQ